MSKNVSRKERHAAREFVVQALYQLQINADTAFNISAQFFAKEEFIKVDKDYFHTVFSAIVKNRESLDALIDSVSSITLTRIDPVEHGILWLAAYELQERIDVPYKVVINEAVELAKSYGATDSYKFVNATVDKLSEKLREVEVSASKK